MAERIQIPGLGRSIPAKPPAPTEKAGKPKNSETYGIPFGTYDVNGRRFKFSYDANLFSTKVREFVNGRWSSMVMPGDIEEAVDAIKAGELASETCTECGRPLTRSGSIQVGKGDTCQGKHSPEELDAEKES
ncbi:DUF6011 domain-containing protein [Nocardia brasiliensis]|uniref:DUF6011 domain-containing protein n=1 Tax=Nocardia brasiliensis TaxID=37326 RepID=UPI002456C5A2|nr:DUF6011 domain-containing protein [Nocardia brasiliensis]